MRRIGFSTGALAYGDFRRALEMLRAQREKPCCVELSALRLSELPVLTAELPRLDLRGYEFTSVHVPSSFPREQESYVLGLLQQIAAGGFPLVVHPDVIYEPRAWAEFGRALIVENMDKRKPIGRTRQELSRIFDLLPEARFCFDVGHAHQVDPTMTEAAMILSSFGSRLFQVHLSQVNTASKHERLTSWSILAFRRVADLIPDDTPIILETPVSVTEVAAEIAIAQETLPSMTEVAAD